MTMTTAPRDRTMQEVARSQRPATPGQRSYIEALLAERNTSGTKYEGWQPDWSKATLPLASQVIHYLSSLPRKSSSGSRWGSIPVGGAGYGYYALEVEGETRFYRVERPSKGAHAGKTFVKAQASDALYPVPNFGEVLSAIAADPEAAGLRYAAEIGKCSRCNRTLTDAESRARGLGPDCAARGW